MNVERISAVSPSPLATLVATTREAELALDGRSEVRITRFPFRVGRENRLAASVDPSLTERRLGNSPQLNDVYLVEPASHLSHVSREHFAIEYAVDQCVLVDRGSACGTIVAGRKVGGNRKGGRTELRSGDEIVVGTDGSPYVFRFEIVAEDS
jgi:pSer/pThr/pTyr-binding forkhead associated (FHA) protein